MKTTINITLLALLTLGLSACSAPSVKPHFAVKNLLLDSTIKVAPIDKPKQLSERTKGQALGKFVASSVVGNLAVGGGDTSSIEAMNASLEISKQVSQAVHNNLPDSYTIDSGAGADLALAKKLSDYFSGRTPSTTPNDRVLTLVVSASLWELGYVSFLTSDDYALNYGLKIALMEKQEDKWHHLKSVGCGRTASEKMPLEEWKAESYQAVDENAKLVVDACFNKFLTETSLQ